MPAQCKELGSGADSSCGESAVSHRPRPPRSPRRLAQPLAAAQAPAALEPCQRASPAAALQGLLAKTGAAPAVDVRPRGQRAVTWGHLQCLHHLCSMVSRRVSPPRCPHSGQEICEVLAPRGRIHQ